MPYKDKADARAWVDRNRTKVRATTNRIWRSKVQRNQAIMDEARNKPCMDCGGTFPLVAMDFDHVRGPKVDNVSRLARDGCGVDKLLREIAKCEVVCSNCHRVRTYQRMLEADRLDEGGVERDDPPSQLPLFSLVPSQASPPRAWAV